jgi:hypothetical protein
MRQNHPSLTKMRRFDNFLAAKQNNEQTTSGNDQNAADQNQLCRHEEFLSRKLLIIGCLPASLPATKGVELTSQVTELWIITAFILLLSKTFTLTPLHWP